jgi:hypothetical protein
MRNGGRILLAVLNLYVRIKIRVATFDTNHSVTESMQSIAASIQKLPDSVVKSSQQRFHRWGRCVVWNDQLIHQFEVSHWFFLRVMYIKEKCIVKLYISWFQTFALFWMLYAFFWVIPWSLNFICRRFGTLCLFHLHRRIGVEWLCLKNVGVFIEKEGLARKWPEPVESHSTPIRLWRWNRQGVPKRRHIKFRRRGITQKKAYNSSIFVLLWTDRGSLASSVTFMVFHELKQIERHGLWGTYQDLRGMGCEEHIRIWEAWVMRNISGSERSNLWLEWVAWWEALLFSAVP